MPLEYVVAQRRFKFAGKHQAMMIDAGTVLDVRQLPKLSTLIGSGYVKEIDPMGEKYDPKELQKLAKDVDKNVTEGDPENARTRGDFPGDDAPVGVPNPNVDLRTPETPLANQRVREMEGEDVEGEAVKAVNEANKDADEAAEQVHVQKGRRNDDGFDDMSADQLRAHAAANSIDLAGARSRADMAHAIRNAPRAKKSE
jgi:hypothetical protein